jgi:hypothetical protein
MYGILNLLNMNNYYLSIKTLKKEK